MFKKIATETPMYYSGKLTGSDRLPEGISIIYSGATQEIPTISHQNEIVELDNGNSVKDEIYKIDFGNAIIQVDEFHRINLQYYEPPFGCKVDTKNCSLTL